MSIVPEEGSILSNATNVNNDINGKIEESNTPTGMISLNLSNKWNGLKIQKYHL